MRKEIFIIFLIILFAGLITPVSGEDAYRIYALACPFPTVTDELSIKDLRDLLSGSNHPEGEIRSIFLTSEAAADLSARFPDISENLIRENAPDEISTLRDGAACALLPIDELNPALKHVRTGHAFSPWDEVYDPGLDFLAVPSAQPNFDPNRATTVLLTGTTAFARTVSYKMSVNGASYPAELIKSVFDSCDITHISNESSIWSLCPVPSRENVSIQFCSGPEAADVLDYLDVDVIELTGNHLRDYDWKPLAEMLDLFDDKGYAWYGAGRDLESAAKPLFTEHNGNRFVFLGCNCAGPDHVYATDSLPGVLPCDFDRMEEEIRTYASEGYQVIVTLQYYELYSHLPSDIQKRDFQRLSDAGAVIVSGSQAHLPQIMVPGTDRFIHFGLGNLFFDQMDVPVKGTKREFLDRYVFYDGRLLTVELVTAVLTDYSRPRLMTPQEREEFLTDIFSLMD